MERPNVSVTSGQVQVPSLSNHHAQYLTVSGSYGCCGIIFSWLLRRRSHAALATPATAASVRVRWIGGTSILAALRAYVLLRPI